MTKLSAAIALAVALAGPAAYAEQPAPNQEMDCIALTLSDGKFDCIPEGEPTPGKYHFMTWENNGQTIVSGYPVLVGMDYIRVNQATDFPMCNAILEAAWNHPDFEKYDEIWCVRAGG